MKFLAALVIALVLASCSGSHSTISQGYAFQMSKDQASNLVDSVIRANVAQDRMLQGSELVASGYDRSLTDTQTYTLSAIPVPSRKAYGFEVTHEGTMFNGPTKAKRIFDSAVQRASVIGPRVSVAGN
jgi:hypothetical protein